MKRSSPLNRQFALACSMNSMRKVLSNLKRKLKCSHFRRPAVAIAMATTQLTATNALLSIKYAITGKFNHFARCFRSVPAQAKAPAPYRRGEMGRVNELTADPDNQVVDSFYCDTILMPV